MYLSSKNAFFFPTQQEATVPTIVFEAPSAEATGTMQKPKIVIDGVRVVITYAIKTTEYTAVFGACYSLIFSYLPYRSLTSFPLNPKTMFMIISKFSKLLTCFSEWVCRH